MAYINIPPPVPPPARPGHPEDLAAVEEWARRYARPPGVDWDGVAVATTVVVLLLAGGAVLGLGLAVGFMRAHPHVFC